MKIVIPMSGIGKRFLEAGYSVPKPLIKIDGKPFSKAELVQLRCYYDILIRQPKGVDLHSLSQKQVYDLLHWSAEKHRISLSRERG